MDTDHDVTFFWSARSLSVKERKERVVERRQYRARLGLSMSMQIQS